MTRERPRWDWDWVDIVLAAPLLALPVALALLASGVAPSHVRPAAVLLAIGVVAWLIRIAGDRGQRRLGQRLQTSKLRWGTRFARPWWHSVSEVASAAGGGAIVGAVLAMAGLPGVGVGILLTCPVLWIAFVLLLSTASARALTFEDDGLRVHLIGGAFLVRWSPIVDVDRKLPRGLTMLQLAAMDVLAETATPDTPAMRQRVSTFVREFGRGGKLVFLPWTAGLDSWTLMRFIEEGRAGRRGQPN